MFLRYWMWIGETARSTPSERSSHSPVTGFTSGSSGAASALTSWMKRIRFCRNSARACGGMSEAG